jgi:acyl carrier protein
MNDEEVLGKLKGILTSDFRVPAEKVSREATFRGTFGMDSLDAVDFIYLVSKEFGVKADVGDFRELHTLGKVVDYLVKRVGEKAAGA